MTRNQPVLVVVLAVALAAVALVACSKGDDLTRPKALAFEKLGQYGPEVSALIGEHGDLRTRLERVAQRPEAGGVATALEAQHATIKQLKGLLDGYAVAIEKAGKDGAKGIEAEVGRFETAMKDGLASAKAGLAAVKQQLDGLEAVAPGDGDAGVPSDGGAASDAGVPSDGGAAAPAGAVDAGTSDAQLLLPRLTPPPGN